MEKFIEYIRTAEEKIQNTDHMIYVTFPLIKDKRLLLKILSEINLIILNLLNAILQYEYILKKIKLSKDARINLKIFIEQCAPHYKISDAEIKLILEVLELGEKHKKSPFEFIKEEKVVILSENLNPSIVTIEKAKEFILLCRSLLKKTREKIYKIV